METIKSDNELIAEFIGAVNCVPDGWTFPNGWLTVRKLYHVDELYFHKSWDWLMPVWYKFKSLIFPDYKQSEHYGQYKQIIKHAIINDGIETACKELVEGIKWYNQQPK